MSEPVDFSSITEQIRKNNSELTILEFSSKKLGEVGGAAVACTLEMNTTLTVLDLSSNGLRDFGAMAILRSLMRNNTLTTLKLGHNNIRHGVGQHVQQMLLSNSTLMTLSLEGNFFISKGGTAIAGGLESNTTLTDLDLSFNYLGFLDYDIDDEDDSDGRRILVYNDEEMRHLMAFAHMLERNTTLKTLNLSGNELREVSGNAVAEALKRNPTLTKLNLKGNELGSSLDSFASMLQENISLRTLILSKQYDGHEFTSYCDDFFDYLPKNSTLTSLDLSHNKFGPNATYLYNIEICFKINTTLTSMDLSGNRLTDDILILLYGIMDSRESDENELSGIKCAIASRPR